MLAIATKSLQPPILLVMKSSLASHGAASTSASLFLVGMRQKVDGVVERKPIVRMIAAHQATIVFLMGLCYILETMENAMGAKRCFLKIRLSFSMVSHFILHLYQHSTLIKKRYTTYHTTEEGLACSGNDESPVYIQGLRQSCLAYYSLPCLGGKIILAFFLFFPVALRYIHTWYLFDIRGLFLW